MQEYFTKKEAIQFIVDHAGAGIPEHERRAWRSRVNTTFTRKMPKDDKYSREQILIFARAHYGLEHFKDCPLDIMADPICLSGEGAIVAGSAYRFSTPSDHKECQPLFAKLYGEIHQLKDEIRKRDGRIAELEPMANRYKENCQRLSDIAKLPRKS